MPEQDNLVIDLPLYAESLMEYLKGSIERFAEDHADIEISCIALYFTTYGSSVYINYETQAHSDALVSRFRGDAANSYAIVTDAGGCFHKEMNDFEYGQHDEFAFEGLPNFYEAKWPIKFRCMDGAVREVASLDENVGRVLLEAFEPVLKSFKEFGDLKRSEVFRMGLAVHNTDCEAFWQAGKKMP